MNRYRFRGQRLTDDINPYLPTMQKGGFLGMRRYNEPGLKGRTRGRQSSIDFNDKGLSMHGNAKIKYYGNPVSKSSQGSMPYQPLATTNVDTPISERGYSTSSDESFWKSEEGQKLMKDWNIPIGQPSQSASSSQSMPRNRYGRIIFNPYIPRQIQLNNAQQSQSSVSGNSPEVQQSSSVSQSNSSDAGIQKADYSNAFTPKENYVMMRNNPYIPFSQGVPLQSYFQEFYPTGQQNQQAQGDNSDLGLNPTPDQGELLSRGLDFSLQKGRYDNAIDSFMEQGIDEMRYKTGIPAWGMQPITITPKLALPPILSQPVAGQRPTVTPIRMKCGGQKAQIGTEILPLTENDAKSIKREKRINPYFETYTADGILTAGTYPLESLADQDGYLYNSYDPETGQYTQGPILTDQGYVVNMAPITITPEIVNERNELERARKFNTWWLDQRKDKVKENMKDYWKRFSPKTRIQSYFLDDEDVNKLLNARKEKAKKINIGQTNDPETIVYKTENALNNYGRDMWTFRINGPFADLYGDYEGTTLMPDIKGDPYYDDEQVIRGRVMRFRFKHPDPKKEYNDDDLNKMRKNGELRNFNLDRYNNKFLKHILNDIAYKNTQTNNIV